MVFQVENALKEAGDKIDANDKAAVEADLNALKDYCLRLQMQKR